jgi:predicted lipoprotein with Yx(FWY)xxD motif
MKLKSLAPLGATIVVVAIAIVVLAGGASAKARPHVAAGSAISIRHTAVGQTLVDAKGRTLYLFEGDKRNLSKLSAAGRAVWPPFIATGRVKAEGGAKAGKIGTTTSGFKQVTYNGHPLYYYVGDHGAGSTRGQDLKEFGALWFVVSANGNANTASAAAAVAGSQTAPAPAPAPTPSYGY